MNNFFDFTDVEVKNEYATLPAGEYPTLIEEIKLEDSKNKEGVKFLSFTFSIIEGDNKGRKIFKNLIVKHSNTEAIRISREQIRTISDLVKLNPKFKGMEDMIDKIRGKRINVVTKIKDNRSEVSYFKEYKGEQVSLSDAFTVDSLPF